MERQIYLDYNATAPIRPEGRLALVAALDLIGNASSPHAGGQRARSLVEQARRDIAAAVGGDRREVVFTAGATEALNLAVSGVTRALAGDRDHVLVSAVEHDAVLAAADALRAEGIRVDEIPVDGDGVIRLDALRELLRPRTALVAVMAANNETGVLQPIEAVAPLVHAAGALLLVDGAQAFGRIPLNFRGLAADFLVLSSHKLGGPLGAGALMVRRGVPLEPILHGGGQERGLRPGTENVPALVGFAAAAVAAVAALPDETRRLADLRDRLEAAAGKAFDRLRVNGRGAARLAGTTSLTLCGLDAQTLVVQLDQEGIAVSTGAACSSGAAEPSHVLRAMGVAAADIAATLRISLGWATPPGDIAIVLAALVRAVESQERGGVAAYSALSKVSH